MFERFTEHARRAVAAAQEEARVLGHNHIASEHLLLGLLHEQDGTAARALTAAGVTAEAARAQVRELAGPGDESPAGHIRFTRGARKVLEFSLREAFERGSRHIGTEHIALGLMRDPGDAGDAGAQVLERLGGPLPALRRRVLEAAREAAPGPAAEEGEAEAWAREWPPAQPFTAEARVQPQTVIGFRNMLAPIDRRLAGIERQLGIAAGEEAAGGFRGLLTSVHRRLANIERHLGAAAGDGPDKPGAPPAASG